MEMNLEKETWGEGYIRIIKMNGMGNIYTPSYVHFTCSHAKCFACSMFTPKAVFRYVLSLFSLKDTTMALSKFSRKHYVTCEMPSKSRSVCMGPKDPRNGTNQLSKSTILAAVLHAIFRLGVDLNET
jgi:hypothetical protein